MNKAALSLAVACWLSASALAHPVPFSFIDARLEAEAIDVTVVAHIFDLANDLKIQPIEKLLERETLAAQAGALARLLDERLQVRADGRPLKHGGWSAPEALPERQSVRFRARYALEGPFGRADVVTLMFPYDPQHKSFLNVFENGQIAAQAILDKNKTTFEYFMSTGRGVRAVVRRFLGAGARHFILGADHLLFLASLLLLGGTTGRLLIVVAAFAVAHSVTLSLAALGIVIPPANAIEPAIALSVVYVGADNLLMGAGGRDTRAWVAAGFGLIHGFGFASALRAMDLPNRGLGWALFSFNIGVEIGLLLVALLVGWLFARIRSRGETAARRLAVAGSVVVTLSGVVWFVQRVFFSGGTA
jgi:hypothetical protein